MNSSQASAALALVVALLTSCGVHMIGSARWFKDEHQPDLFRRASFDLRCSESALSVVPLGAGGDYKNVGVQGCGRRISYVWISGPSGERWATDVASSR